MTWMSNHVFFSAVLNSYRVKRRTKADVIQGELCICGFRPASREARAPNIKACRVTNFFDLGHNSKARSHALRLHPANSLSNNHFLTEISLAISMDVLQVIQHRTCASISANRIGSVWDAFLTGLDFHGRDS